MLKNRTNTVQQGKDGQGKVGSNAQIKKLNMQVCE
jgi:hypothetical protein